MDIHITVFFKFIFTQYSKASTTLSVASIRQQFSVPENIKMSQQSFQFLEEIGQHLAVDGYDPPDIQLYRRGYLFLASKAGEEVLRKNHALQRYTVTYNFGSVFI